MIGMQTKQPGRFDGKLMRSCGEHYSEARHGLNPLGQGFNICAPYRAGARVEAGGTRD